MKLITVKKKSRNVLIYSLCPLILCMSLLFGCSGKQKVKPSKENAKFYLNRGLNYSSRAQYDRAIAEYTEGLKLNPSFPEIYYNNRGNAYRRLGDNDLAIADYTKAIELNSRFVEAYFNRGNAYNSKGKHRFAIADYTKAIGLNPKNAGYYQNRAVALFREKNYDNALADVKRCRELGGTPHPDFNRALQQHLRQTEQEKSTLSKIEDNIYKKPKWLILIDDEAAKPAVFVEIYKFDSRINSIAGYRIKGNDSDPLVLGFSPKDDSGKIKLIYMGGRGKITRLDTNEKVLLPEAALSHSLQEKESEDFTQQTKELSAHLLGLWAQSGGVPLFVTNRPIEGLEFLHDGEASILVGQIHFARAKYAVITPVRLRMEIPLGGTKFGRSVELGFAISGDTLTLTHGSNKAVYKKTHW